MSHCQSIRIFINQKPFRFSDSRQTGRSIKEQAGISLCRVLFTRDNPKGKHNWGSHRPKKDIIENDEAVILHNGQRFKTIESKREVIVKVNLEEYEFCDPLVTGREIKELAGIELSDVLFRNEPDEDEVVPNDTKIKLKRGDCFYSAPPANYGLTHFTTEDVGCDQFECLPQPNGWTFLRVLGFKVPNGYTQDKVSLLLKIPPGFPDAAPDMFWVTPHLKTASGAVPQGTSHEAILGEQWQRFSWHLRPGAWRPGISTLRDFMRCVYARFDKRN